MTDPRPMVLTSAERVQCACLLLAGHYLENHPDNLLKVVETVRDIEQAVLYDLQQTAKGPITEEVTS